MTRAPCRRRTGEALPRAEKFGDLKTADHKVLNEGCESRDNHCYAVVVQDLATQWIQYYLLKTKTSHEKVCRNFWSRRTNRKLFTPTTRWNFGKACEDLSWNHRTSTPHRSETHGFAERAVRRVKEGTSAVLLQSGLDEKWWSDSMECYGYLRNIQDVLTDGKTPHERRFGEPFKGPIIPFGAMVEYHPTSPKDQARLHQFGKKEIPGIFLGYELVAGGLWKGDILIADLEDLAKEVLITKSWWIHIPSSRFYSKIVRKRLRIPRTHSKAGTDRKEWRSQKRTSRWIGRVSTGKHNRWHWSLERLLVDQRWPHLSSSQWTSSSTLRAEGRSIP